MKVAALQETKWFGNAVYNVGELWSWQLVDLHLDQSRISRGEKE